MTTSSTHFDVLAAITRADGLLLRADATRLGFEHELRHALARGQVLRLRYGVYVSAQCWATLDATERYLCRIRACAVSSPEPPVFSHYSAAALWGLPRPTAWPTDVHITVPQASGGRSRHGVVRHAVERQPRVVMRDGLQVASITDTVVEMARVLPFPEAVAMMDRAIHVPRHGDVLATRDELELSLQALAGPLRVPGRTAALRAGEFASTQSGSGGESYSRAHMALLGFVVPELQVRFDDAQGFIAFVDFFWRVICKVGEFDGQGKYVKEEYTGGRPTSQIVLQEKRREDRVRALGPTFARWDWETARDPVLFGRFLSSNGVPRAR